MKEFIKNPLNLNKIEFWASTSLYVFAVFILVTKVSRGVDYSIPDYAGGHNIFIPYLCRYTVLYAGFLLFNFQILPSLVKKHAITVNVISVLAMFFVIGMTYGVTDTYLKADLFARYKSNEEFYNFIFQNSYIRAFWLIMMLSFYTLIKYASYYLLNYLDQVEPRYYQITRECIIALIAWMAVFFILISKQADFGYIGLWGFLIPFAIGLYWFSFYRLIPDIKAQKLGFGMYLRRVLLIVIVSVVPISLILIAFDSRSEFFPIINMFNVGFQLLFTVPFTWQVYKYRSDSDTELYKLKTALGQSKANYNLLQSQINPHFLFNALNTLYGTALQENAERTGEGIQRLGDMMRFMLHENMQENISLIREVDYLNSFIGLQKLRTQTSPDIQIQTEIDDNVNELQITPMLLIPFVENAFKHGISLREPSYIKITLQTKGNTLYFDVHNSIHIKKENDPERNHSGIGLKNVQQRLKLLYPQKHELIIRESGKEFFIHLTMELSSFKPPEESYI